MLFSLLHLILCFLLSRTGVAFALVHHKYSKCSFLCDYQCLVNLGCLEVVDLFFIPGSATE